MSLNYWRATAFAFLVSAVVACAPTQDLAGAVERQAFAERADALAVEAAPDAAARIRADVEWLADDDREGREAGTEGYETAARYVAERFAAMGLSPAVDGRAYLQPVNFRLTSRIVDAAQMAIVGDGAAQDLIHLEDFLIGQNSRETEYGVEGDVVFVGFGVSDPARGYDDYAGVDATGKIVAFFSGAPDYLQSEERAYFASNTTKMRTAAGKGAIGALFLTSISGSERFPWSRMVANPTSPSLTWLHADGSAATAAPEIRAGAVMSPAGAAKLFAGAPMDFATVSATGDEEGARFEPFDLGVRVRIAGASAFDSMTSPNVVGFIEGSDPVLKNEVVILTAHLDHTGIRDMRDGDTAETDRINNGAMDNAMGVSSMLEVARRIAEGPRPRRTIAFAAVTAEEKGLLGAAYLASHPPFGNRRMVANVNLDMPLTLFPFTEIVAFGAERSTIGDAVGEAAAAMSLRLVDDPVPQQSLFTRSDHYRFVEKGVPAVFIFLGFEGEDGGVFGNFMRDHYHRPSDDPSLPIDYAASAVFADLNFRIVNRLANDDATPAWRKGEFFASAFGGLQAGE